MKTVKSETLPFFETASWYEALGVAERLPLLRAGEMSDAAIDSALAGRRLERWRSQSPFQDDSFFLRRLVEGRITEREFVRLLGAPVEQLQRGLEQQPAWLREIERLYTAWAAAPESSGDRVGDAGGDAGDWGLLWIAMPLIEDGRRRLREGVARLTEPGANGPIPGPERTEALLLPHLLGQLGAAAGRTMVLELNVARVEGRLAGADSEARFQDFLRQLRDPMVSLTILREYPVLARHLRRCVNYWLRNSLEFLERLCADWDELRGRLAPEGDPGPLAALQGGAGDTHRGGHSVMVAGFASGFRLVYKPRSLAVDAHFGALLAWLNRRGAEPSFEAPRVIDRGAYGWAEFVPVRECASPAEAGRFYERLGGLLAVLHVLEATDFHHENLIACGEHPVLIDLEALFHPRMARPRRLPSLEFSQRLLSESVMRIGLLPHQLWINARGEGLDVSGMGGAAGQMTPFSVLTTDRPGTDEMRLVRRPVRLDGGRNRPVLRGEAVGPEAYGEELQRGFVGLYRLLLRHRDELLAPDGPIEAFAEDEVRLIARPTQIYGRLLQESFHPNLLRSALDRDRLFDRLWVGVEARPELARLTMAEQADLHRGDIPIFTTRPGSARVWSSLGLPIDGVIEARSLDAVRGKIESLSEEDLRRQLWFVRHSLATEVATRGPLAAPPGPSHEPHASDDPLAAAREIGDALLAAAFRERGLIAWVGLSMVGENAWSIAPVERDLYGGLTGIAVFLASRGEQTRHARYIETAQHALRTARRQFIETRRARATMTGPVGMSIGAFTGDGGLVFALAHLAARLREPGMLAQAEEHVLLLRAAIAHDRVFDLLGGAAGYLCILCGLYQQTGSAAARDSAADCVEHLLAHATSMPGGIGWTPDPSRTPLTGFSHGAAGIAHALLRAWQTFGDDRCLLAAVDAMNYERTHYLPEERNWRDLRTTSPSSSPCATAWCHGAPGIGLGRLLAWSLLREEQVREEIEIALETTLQTGLDGSHSLCHGEFGNLDLALEASQLPEFAFWKAPALRRGGWLLHERLHGGWRCAAPRGAQPPGLMLGLAGIGYGLLRLHDPTRVPSVLLLQQ
ncbi:MAG: type 2 lanthipeptide synthetase LanM family protein [Blastocatellia bacterium]|nr:type 2 lanthipeptide synthetase LanM family protein [Blastocatellia bacterium]